MEVEGTVIDFHNVIFVVGHVEGGSLVGQKFKKSIEDIRAGSGSQDDNFFDILSLKDVHESNDLL